MTEADKKLVFSLAQRLTGVHPDGTYHHAIFITNIERRMRETGHTSLSSYIKLTESDPSEHAHLLSSLSIHTTAWFRENPHYVIFQQILLESMSRQDVFRVWSAACSTGEEVYTFALMLEEFRRFHPKFDYKILGTDIDPVSLEKARKAVFPKKQLTGPITYYKNHVLLGSGSTENFFTFTKAIRERCEFKKHDIRDPIIIENSFDMVVCRNVLIYFAPDQVEKTIKMLLSKMREGAHLVLGHSEIVNPSQYALSSLGHSVYRKPTKTVAPIVHASKAGAAVRVLIVDDSKTVREYLRKEVERVGLQAIPAKSAQEADEILKETQVQLITLDLNMPGTSGEDWLRQVRKRGIRTPIVIISNTLASQTGSVMKLLSEGAQAYLEKEDMAKSPELFTKTVIPLLEAGRNNSNNSNLNLRRLPAASFHPDVILIGASTGGPSALATILKDLPPWTPPIVLVQHISVKFSEPFANRVVDVSKLRLGKIEDGAILQPGHIYVALGDYHIGIRSEKEGLKLSIAEDSARNGHRPSVDHLFYSAQNIARPMAAMLLTGMGRDGADGLKALNNKGVYTMAQGEEDCVVFGMPREAILRNAVDYVGNCSELYEMLKSMLPSIGAVGF